MVIKIILAVLTAVFAVFGLYCTIRLTSSHCPEQIFRQRLEIRPEDSLTEVKYKLEDARSLCSDSWRFCVMIPREQC